MFSLSPWLSQRFSVSGSGSSVLLSSSRTSACCEHPARKATSAKVANGKTSLRRSQFFEGVIESLGDVRWIQHRKGEIEKVGNRCGSKFPRLIDLDAGPAGKVCHSASEREGGTGEIRSAGLAHNSVISDFQFELAQTIMSIWSACCSHAVGGQNNFI